ncbi:MAG: response regulator transcription factor [Pedobacter sp.]|nr:MAG: response regulator transcription factor [Pedobacter sp.]
MFKKVLIAEDHESTNISVRKTLADLGIKNANYVYYCDDALVRVKKAAQNKNTYDLLITDLSFEEDHNVQQITGGVALIKAAKQIQPDLKILVFSAENKQAFIETLFKELEIDGYVRKARYDAQELKAAIMEISEGKKYVSVSLRQVLKQKNSHEFTTLDVNIISLLSQGIHQKNIPTYLQEKNIKPSGLSSIEKRLGLMKDVLGFTKNEQLIVFCKDMGII